MSTTMASLDDRFSHLIKLALKPQLISLQKNLIREIQQLKQELRQSIEEIKADCKNNNSSGRDNEAKEVSLISNPSATNSCQISSQEIVLTKTTNPSTSTEFQKPSSLPQPICISPKVIVPSRKTLIAAKRASRVVCRGYAPVQLSASSKPNFTGCNNSGSSSENPYKSVLDIRAKTKEQEVQLTTQEVEDIANSKQVLPGLTMRGEDIQEILAAIPNEFNVTVAVEFTNHLDATLTDPQCWLDSGSVYGLLPSILEEATKESFSFHDNNFKEAGVNGLFSYKISPTLRLAISFGVDNSGTTLLGVAFTPEDVPAGEELDDYMWNVVKQDEMRSDIKCANWSSEKKDVIVKMRNLRARVTMTPGPKSVMQVTVLKTCTLVRADLEEKLVAIILKGKINSKQPPPSPACKRGNVIEITNLLKVCLQDGKRYVPSNTPAQDFLPDIIPEFTRVSFSTFDLKNSEEIFSYRIDSTDLRLAITFCTKTGEGYFAIAFIPEDVPTDVELISSMTKPGEWVTRPDRKSGLAKDGEQVIEVRNMRAKVTMTEEPKVMLMVIISSF